MSDVTIPEGSEEIARAAEAWTYSVTLYRSPEGLYYVQWGTGTCEMCGGGGVEGPYVSEDAAIAQGCPGEDEANALRDDLESR